MDTPIGSVPRDRAMTTVRALLLIAAFALFPASLSAQYKPEFSLSINASEAQLGAEREKRSLPR